MSNVKKVLIEKNKSCKTIWFMRQAGRYLPEFRKIRSKNPNFINLCLNSDLSCKITLQPITRFDIDSAIIFSDILLVPYALNQNVEFIKDKGPVLDKFDKEKFFKTNKQVFIKKLSPVYDAIKKTRKNLNKDKSLIAFIGAPWTLLVYMMNLKISKKKIDIMKFENSLNDINLILNDLIDYLCLHIKKQIDAGADVVQIFDSWAGLLPEKYINELCFLPNKKIVDFCKRIDIPVICFPKGINHKYSNFNNIVKPDGINLDYEIDPSWAKKELKNVVIQGGMDPKILLKSDKEIYNSAKKYLDIFRDVPYIFNLGHGLVPETNPDKLSKLIKFIRDH